MSSQLINKTVNFVKETLANSEGGHDWWHIYRVWKLSKQIASVEPGVDMLTVELGALLHDIADSKFHDGDEELGPKLATEFLKQQKVNSSIIEHVVNIINHISFKNSFGAKTFSSKELDVVQDADRLDAMGAIGIARTFNYGGHKGRALYDPAIKPATDLNKESYKKSTAPTINHFYEKLLLLKDKMNTESGKQMAIKRHQFMEQFLNEFYDEWEGKK